jgi:stearoyl-CoA desaturase (delta-9 desaturase)
MGEGYHNYHHEFQHDYRNGVKPWQFDPTKWLIWTLSKLRLVRNLRRVPADKIRSAQREAGERVAGAPAGRNAPETYRHASAIKSFPELSGTLV